MRALAVLLAALLLLGLGPVTIARSSPGAPLALAPGVSLWRNYSDPASDVQQFYTSNGTPLVSGGSFVYAPTPSSANLLELHSAPAGGNLVTITIKLSGRVGTTTNFTYTFDLYTDVNDQVHYVVNYTGGSGAMWLSSNRTSGFTPVNITGNSRITSSSDNFRDELVLTVDLSLIPTVTAWDVDALAVERDAYYTYKDFIYLVPGHPGTAPAAVLGHVFVEGSNTTLANVTISTDVGGYTTVSDASGAYVLYLPLGTYNVTAHRDGYRDATYHVVVTQAGTAVTHDFQLAPLSPLDEVGVLTLLLIVAALVGGVLVALFLLLRRRGGQGFRPP